MKRWKRREEEVQSIRTPIILLPHPRSPRDHPALPDMSVVNAFRLFGKMYEPRMKKKPRIKRGRGFGKWEFRKPILVKFPIRGFRVAPVPGPIHP